MLSDAVRLIPRLADARLLRSWAGVRQVPVDGCAILGQVDRVDGFLVAVMHRGVTLAPIIGRILIDPMASGGMALDIASRASGPRLATVWEKVQTPGIPSSNRTAVRRVTLTP